MAALKISPIPLRSFSFHPVSSPPPSKPFHFKKLHSRSNFKSFLTNTPKIHRVLRSVGRSKRKLTVRRLNSEDGKNSIEVEDQRPPFDLNLAVVLAGFAFEAYSSPPEIAGWREMDAADCQTVFLSKLFLREVYDGQLAIKLKKGVDFPAMDPWGTSDPYVIFQLDGQVAKSKVKWATREPVWNEDFTLNIKIPPTKFLQVAAWDANLVTPHKRMGNAGLNLESICDGNLHEVVVELEGIGGGGKIYLEARYKSYDEIDEEKQWWRIPFVSDFLMKSSLGSALKVALGSESVNASQFVQSAFGQLKPFYYTYLQKDLSSNSDKEYASGSGKSLNTVSGPEQFLQEDMSSESSVRTLDAEQENSSPVDHIDDAKGNSSFFDKKINESVPPDDFFWKTFADIISQTVLQKLGFSLPEIKMWEGFDLLNKMSIQSQKIAEEEYVESGLATPVATPETKDDNNSKSNLSSINGTLSSLLDIRKASWDVLSQMETILGAVMVLTANLSQQSKDISVVEDESKNDASMTKLEDVAGHSLDKTGNIAIEGLALDNRKAEEMRELFSSAESAMEAWAMLATSLGRTSFIKSEFEKICFLDNDSTDTQASVVLMTYSCEVFSLSLKPGTLK